MTETMKDPQLAEYDQVLREMLSVEAMIARETDHVMRRGLEERHAMLFRRLAEIAVTVPAAQRPDRGWQKAGDAARRVVKAAVVAGAMRGIIPRAVASRIVSSKTLKGA